MPFPRSREASEFVLFVFFSSTEQQQKKNKKKTGSLQLSEEPLSILVQADTLLETGEFAEFWRFIEPHRGLFVGSNSGFFSAVSAFILGVIELTYRRVAKSILATSLHIGDKELAELVTTRRWAISGDDVVITEQQATLTQKRPQPSDPINLEQLSKILTALQQ